MRVLVVRLGAFGDIIHSLPLAADLHAAGHRVDWLCEDRWAPLLRDNPVVGHLHLLPRARWRQTRADAGQRWADLRRLLRTLRHQGYHVAIDAQGLAKSALATVASGAMRRVGHRRPRAREGSWLATGCRTPCSATHVIDQQRALALAVPGGRRPAGGWRFPLPAWQTPRAHAACWLQERGLIRPWALNVGAGWPSKVWPEPHQRALAQALDAAGQPLLLLWGSPTERALAERLAAGTPSAVLAPPTDIPDLAGFLAACGVVISGDTGPLHLAFALGTPTVGLFGPVPGRRNGPRGQSHEVLQAPGVAWERHDPDKGGMASITVEAVIDAARRCRTCAAIC